MTRHRKHTSHTHQRPAPATHLHHGADPTPLLNTLRILRSALHSRTPLDLLKLVSAIVAAEEHDDNAGALRDLVGILDETTCAETTATLRLVGAFARDEHLRAHVSGILSSRREHLPLWLAHLDEARIDGDVLLVTDTLGDRSAYFFGVRLADGTRFTAAVITDNNVSGAVRDATAVCDTPHEAAAILSNSIRLGNAVDIGVQVAHPRPADVRAALVAALSKSADVVPPFESETWPANRPLVEWAVGLLPPGGTATEPPTWTDDDLDMIADTFFASPAGRAVYSLERRILLSLALIFAAGERGGDPLHWSPVAVTALLGWVRQPGLARAVDLAQFPGLLTAWVAYTCRLRGIDARLTEQILVSVDQIGGDFLRLLDDLDQPYDTDEHEEDEEGHDLLKRAVGGEEQLANLDAAPLPDEPFDWSQVPEDIRPVVTKWLALADRCADELFDVEHRTVFRRCLARAAAGKPELFKNAESSADGTSGLVQAAAEANHSAGPRGPLQDRNVLDWFEANKPSSQRSEEDTDLLPARWVNFSAYTCILPMRSPDLLVARRRAKIIAIRDRDPVADGCTPSRPPH